MKKAVLPALTLTLMLAACTTTNLPGTPVTSTADSGPGSLRGALGTAQDGDTLRFTLSGTVTLASPLAVDRDVTIVADGVTLDAAGKGRVLEVAPGAEVTLKGGTLEGGVGSPITLAGSGSGLGAQATSRATYGGVIVNAGRLTLDGTTVGGGEANNGGGIANLQGATLLLTGNARVTGNDASPPTPDLEGEITGVGGGIYNAGTLTLAGGRVDGNTATFSAGGIRNVATGTLTLQSGSVSGNACTLPFTGTSASDASGCAGGGVYTTGNMTMAGGTISNNTATYYGGGVAAHARCPTPACTELVYPTFTMSGGTVEGNRTTGTADNAGGGLWLRAQASITGGSIRGNTSMYGGGLQTWHDLDLIGGVIENNTATENGGGVSSNISQSLPATVHLGGTAVIRNNTARNSGGGAVFGSYTEARIDGGRITGNTVTGMTDGGGGVRVHRTAQLTLAGGEISGNTSARTGGGLTVGGQVTMTGGSITGNSVPNNPGNEGAGGVRLYAGARMTASGGSISGNTAPFGGGVFVGAAFNADPAGEFTLAGAAVSGNRATASDGGGFFNDGKLTLTAGSVTGNAATTDGGGILNTRRASYSQTGGGVSGNTPDNVLTKQ